MTSTLSQSRDVRVAWWITLLTQHVSRLSLISYIAYLARDFFL